MLKKVLVTLGLSLALAACMGAPDNDPPADEGAVGTAQQALRPSGRYRTFYSDSTRTVVVGWENQECDWRYDESDGDTSNYYKEFRYDCPEYDSPLLPSTQCWTCTSATSCSLTGC